MTKLSKEIRDRITQHQDMLRVGLRYLEDRWSFNKRKAIKMSDLELDEFLAIVRSEILLVPVDAYLADAFLEKVDARRAKQTRLQRLVRAWRGERRTLTQDYARFVQAAKLAMYLDGQGKVRMKEEIDEEAAAAREAVPAYGQRREHAADGGQGERVEAEGEGVAGADLGGRDPAHQKEAVVTDGEKAVE